MSRNRPCYWTRDGVYIPGCMGGAALGKDHCTCHHRRYMTRIGRANVSVHVACTGTMDRETKQALGKMIRLAARMLKRESNRSKVQP